VQSSRGEEPTILTQEESEALARRVLSMVSGEKAQVTIGSSAGSTTEFARGDTHMARATASVSVALRVEVGSRHAEVATNQIDEAGLTALVREAEALAREEPTPEEWSVLPPQHYLDGPQIYFDATIGGMAPEEQSALFHEATDAAERAGLISAGDVRLSASSRAVLNTAGLSGYERSTYGDFSLTARTRDGMGSGWAWGGYEDWARVDTRAVIERAVDLAQRSAKPVAIEPGRYTVILEPSAVAALIEPILAWWPAQYADGGMSVFARDPLGSNKIGLQMMDRRLGMVSSPWDPERPASTIGGGWSPIPGPVTWFEQGILRNLSYDAPYARLKGREPVMNPGGGRLTAEGPSQTVEEMISSTKRGIWVNRLSHVSTMNVRTLLLTGTTRDGTFLIENGKITKPIRNFRFTDSPFFVLNQLEAWGEAVRASRSVVCPPLKVRDFNFTSLTDAV
jgi:predicted Zn-dependent protease